MFAVASSSINIDGFCAKILANAINCFWPAEYEFPRSDAISSNPLFNEFIKSVADASFTASSTLSSEISEYNFILSFIDFANINGSCNIVPIFFRSDFKFI